MIRKKRIARASFRGVQFYIEELTVETSRRIFKVEFPRSEKFSTEDMGSGIRSYSLVGMVLGPDFEKDRDKLLEACESDEGPGELVIPYFDTLTVHCTSARTIETTMAGGMVTFAMNFCDSSEDSIDVKRDPASQFASSVGGVLSSVSAGISDRLATLSDLGDALQAASDHVLGCADNLEKAFIPFMKANDGMSALQSSILEFKSTLANVTQEPELLLSGLVGLIGTLFGLHLPISPLTVIDTVISTAALPQELAQDEHVSLTEQKELQDFQERFHTGMRASVVAQVASAAAQSNFASQDEAIQARAILLSEIDAIKRKVEDDSLYQNLDDLKVLVFDALPPPQAGRIKTIQLSSDTPLLVLIYDIYGDLSNRDQLLKRNPSIHNPSLIEAGIRLEVVV